MEEETRNQDVPVSDFLTSQFGPQISQINEDINHKTQLVLEQLKNQDYFPLPKERVFEDQCVVFLSCVGPNTKTYGSYSDKNNVVIRNAFTSRDDPLTHEYLKYVEDRVQQRQQVKHHIYHVEMNQWTLIPCLSPEVGGPENTLTYLREIKRKEMEKFVSSVEEFRRRTEFVKEHGLEADKEYRHFKEMSEKAAAHKLSIPTLTEHNRRQSRRQVTASRRLRQLNSDQEGFFESQRFAVVSFIVPEDYAQTKALAMKVHGLVERLDDPVIPDLISMAQELEPYLDVGVVDSNKWLTLPLDPEKHSQTVKYGNQFLEKLMTGDEQASEQAISAKRELRQKGFKEVDFYDGMKT